MFRIAFSVCTLALMLTACGGGGGSSNRAPTTNVAPTPVGEGGLTLLLGDNALDGVEAVLIEISAVRLIGGEGQTDLALEEVPTEVDLLALQNLTEKLFDGDVPEGDYSKIRLEIDSLQVVEEGNPTPVDVQLPANGKIDLNPQGSFSIIPGEELVIEIDIALDRSIHIVSTGNSRYRFRPVVFVDIIDQSDNPRMTRIFGEIASRDEPEAPAFDLCEVDSEACFDITIPEALVMLDEQDQTLEGFDGLADTTFHMFGVYFIEEGEDERVRFRPILAIQAEEAGIDSVFGDISALDLPNGFTLDDPLEDGYNVSLADSFLALNRYGESAELELGHAAEVWSRTPIATDVVSFLTIVRPDEDPDEVEGQLMGIEGDQINIADERCAIVDEETEFQLVEEMGEQVDSSPLDFAGLVTLAETEPLIEIAAFGTQGSACLDATFVVATVESTE